MTDLASLVNSLSCAYRFHIGLMLINYACMGAATAFAYNATIPTFVCSIFEIAGVCLLTDALAKINPTALPLAHPPAVDKALYDARALFIFSAIFYFCMFMVNVIVGASGLTYYSYAAFSFYSYFLSLAYIPLLIGGLTQMFIFISLSRMSVLAGKVRASMLGRHIGDCCGPPVCDPISCCGDCCCGPEAKNPDSCCGYPGSNAPSANPNIVVVASAVGSGPVSVLTTNPAAQVPSAVAYGGSEDVTMRLTKFYSKYDPSKLSDIPEFVAYIKKDGIEAFNVLLRKKYMTDLNTFEI